ncbi:hypothetical protein ACFO6X_04955 [Giesbergeria sinuosa]|uniref:Large polyvalent protein associated domain-containing protein n=2 Tax=Giesbergeria sinuosa TaxID=80883 RepID=A0ABV9QBD6_9BURK
MTKDQFIAEMTALYTGDMWVRGFANQWVRTSEGAAAIRFGGVEYARARGVDEALARLAEDTEGGKESNNVKANTYRRVVQWLAKMADKFNAGQVAAFLRGMTNIEAKAYVRSVFTRLQDDAPATQSDWAFTADDAFSQAPNPSAAERANQLISKSVGRTAPLDAVAHAITRVTGVEWVTRNVYDKAAVLLERLIPERVKAGVVSDYGVPEAVIDQRSLLQGRQRVQLRKTGALVEKLATLTRAESRVAYEWMNMKEGADAAAYDSVMQGLPQESVKVLKEVQQMIDKLSREAVRLGQLSPDAYERHKFAYLHRSYEKYTLGLSAEEKAVRSRAIAVLGEQYQGRGLSEFASMAEMRNAAPEWWGRKVVPYKVDTSLKGQKFIRLERRAPSGEGVEPLPGMEGKQPGKLQEVAYWPVGEPIPSKYSDKLSDWSPAGTWEVRDTQAGKVVLWRDFTKNERTQMGEIDEARFAIAKTLQMMIHDVEVGRYLEWMAQNYGKKDADQVDGTVVDASERMRDTFATNEWVRVPDVKIPGTEVLKYGKLANHYLPGPIWNDVRQVVAGGHFKPFGEKYDKLLSLWKTSKTALSPSVHMNNVMSNFVMADWHDVGAGHVTKALRILLSASQKLGGITDREAAQEVLNRYQDSGGDTGSWATQEIANEQLEPLLAALEEELGQDDGGSMQAQIGVMAALQHASHGRFSDSWAAAVASKPGKGMGKAAKAMIDIYQAEDDVFRLAAWLKAKEDGLDDMAAGKVARKSFLDYSINAPWINAMRKSGWPFLAFTYRAVPMLAEIAAKKPHKLLKLMALAGGLNALGSMLAGGDDDKERKLLPEEKAGAIWGMVPKLIRMPWNDAHDSPVYLDIRRWIPVGDVFDVGQGHAAIPMLPGLMPTGPLAMLFEVVLNKTSFTGKPITQETDTVAQKTAKLADYFYKAFAPNLLLPNPVGWALEEASGVKNAGQTYAWSSVSDAAHGRTDAFGREMSVAQAIASSVGVKLGSYPADVMRRNLVAQANAKAREIDLNISQLRRQYQTHRLGRDEFKTQVQREMEKKRGVMQNLSERLQ